MDRPTKKIIAMIASIQVEAILSIKEDQDVDLEMAKLYLQIKDDELSDSIRQHLEVYKQMEEIPSIIRTLNEYQLLVCSHILFRMESTWILDNSEGVMGAWEEIHSCMDKFHPEFSLSRV